MERLARLHRYFVRVWAGERHLQAGLLPLTLAIIDGLIVKVGEERYIIPTLSVREWFRPRADMITRVHGNAEVVNVRGRLLPLLRLSDLFGIKPASTDATKSIVVVAQSGTNFRCLLVDGLLHKQEVVIKNLNEMMVHKNRALAGAAISGGSAGRVDSGCQFTGESGRAELFEGGIVENAPASRRGAVIRATHAGVPPLFSSPASALY